MTPRSPEEIKENVERLAKEAGFKTMRAFWQEAGVGADTFAEAVRDNRVLERSTLQKVADVLGETVESLMLKPTQPFSRDTRALITRFKSVLAYLFHQEFYPDIPFEEWMSTPTPELYYVLNDIEDMAEEEVNGGLSEDQVPSLLRAAFSTYRSQLSRS